MRPGNFTPIPPKMLKRAHRKQCQVCATAYGSIRCFEGTDKRAFGIRRQHVHHLIPRRWLNHHGIYEHYNENLLSVCDRCHGKAKVYEDMLLKGDVVGFLSGMRQINFPVARIQAFAHKVGIVELAKGLA